MQVTYSGNYGSSPHFALLPGLILLIIPFIITVIAFCRANRFTFGTAIGATVLVILGSAIAIGARYSVLSSNGQSYPDWLEISRVVLGAFLPTLIPFIIMLVQKWKGINRSPLESQPGAAGLSGWLTAWRLIWIAILAAALFVWFDIPFLVVAAVLLAALAAYPLLHDALNTDGGAFPVQAPPPPPPPADDLSAEREKVLCMIADNSITAEEGADLLNALAATRRTSQKQNFTLARGQKLMLAGAILVTIGFFLPWISYNPGQEVTRLSREMGAQVSAQVNTMPGMPSGSVNMPEMPGLNLKTADIQISGSQLGSALGWLILLLSVAAAGLQFLTDVFSPRTRRLLEIASLAATAFLIIYIASNSLRYIAIGLIVVILGYICELLGYLKTTRNPGTKIPATASTQAYPAPATI